jgi:glycosyltransferase involved in cell wall biosynthesis
MGIRVVLVSMGPRLTDAQRRAASAVFGLELRENDLRVEWMSDPWEDVDRAGEWLLDLERRLAPDLIHLNHYAYGALPFSAPKLVVGQSCLCSWFSAVLGAAAPDSYQVYRSRVACGLAGAGAVIAPTQVMLDALAAEYGEGPFDQIRGVIFNGRSAASFDGRRRKEPIVCSAGPLWDRAKNIGTLAQASAGLSWPVVVAGSLEHPDGTRVSLRGVRAVGPQDEPTLATWLARAAIFALPARYEPFGYTALEAALSGCALVLGDIPSLREIWQDAALYAPPEDPIALGRVIEGLARDDTTRVAMAEKARARAARLTPEAMARQYHEIYARLLNREHKPERAFTRRARPLGEALLKMW